MIICDDTGIELGCGEAGLKEEEFETKVMVESNLKAPKIMHDMFVRLSNLLDNKREEVQKLQVVGLVFSSELKKNDTTIGRANIHHISLEFKVRMLLMDCPNGYVCRLKGSTPVEFRGKEEFLGSDFRQVYKMIYVAKVKSLS